LWAELYFCPQNQLFEPKSCCIIDLRIRASGSDPIYLLDFEQFNYQDMPDVQIMLLSAALPDVLSFKLFR
jgi:hypothetical protein